MDEQERLALEYLSGQLATYETRMYDHMATTFRWLMATLFAANGGAIVALLGDPSRSRADSWGLGWFATGIILSLIMGALSAFAGFRMMIPLTNARAMVQQGLMTGEVAEAENAISELVENQKMTWKTWLPTYAGLGSLACFVIGIAVYGASMI